MVYGEVKKRGIYCIETVWYGNDDRVSIRPILEIIEEHYKAPHIHRDAATRGELFHYLAKWGELVCDYPILYLGFHGEKEGKLLLSSEDGQDDTVNGEDVAKRIASLGISNFLVHFASCSSLNDMKTKEFLRIAQASAVSGYSEDVDWVDSAAFELLYLGELQYHGGKSLTPKVADTARKNLRCTYKLGKNLGFDIKVKK